MSANAMPTRTDVGHLAPRLWDRTEKGWISRWRRRGLAMARYAGDTVVSSVWWNGSSDPEIRMQVMGEWGAHGPINKGTTLFAKLCWERGVQVGGVFFDGAGNAIDRNEPGPRMSRGRGVYPATKDHMICGMMWCDLILDHIYHLRPSGIAKSRLPS